MGIYKTVNLVYGFKVNDYDYATDKTPLRLEFEQGPILSLAAKPGSEDELAYPGVKLGALGMTARAWVGVSLASCADEDYESFPKQKTEADNPNLLEAVDNFGKEHGLQPSYFLAVYVG